MPLLKSIMCFHIVFILFYLDESVWYKREDINMIILSAWIYDNLVTFLVRKGKQRTYTRGKFSHHIIVGKDDDGDSKLSSQYGIVHYFTLGWVLHFFQPNKYLVRCFYLMIYIFSKKKILILKCYYWDFFNIKKLTHRFIFC